MRTLSRACFQTGHGGDVRRRNARSHAHHNFGFSLLEAIVAMVLISIAGLALFSWINTSFIGLNRIQESNARAAAQMNALQYLQTINPMARPTGAITLGKLKLTWQARQVSEPAPNILDSGGPGPFTVALYEVEATITELPDVPESRFTVRLVGYDRLPFNIDPFDDGPAKKTAPVSKINPQSLSLKN